MKSLILAAGMILALLTAATPVVAQDIDTRPTQNDVIGPFAQNAGHIFGQTFVVPAGRTRVDSFTFSLFGMESTMSFRARLMAWDTATGAGTGPVLYASAPVFGTNAAQQEFTFAIPGGQAVTAGQTYIVFAEWESGQPTDRADLGLSPGTSYAGGQMYYQIGARIFGGDTDLTTPFRWNTLNGPSYDLSTNIVFDPAAPPPTIPTLSEWAMILMGLMLAGAGAVFVTRRRWV